MYEDTHFAPRGPTSHQHAPQTRSYTINTRPACPDAPKHTFSPGGPGGPGGPSRVLLLVVAPAVEPRVSDVAGGGERPLARGALQALLVPGRVVDPQQEAVRDDPRAALAHGPLERVPAWRRGRGGQMKRCGVDSFNEFRARSFNCNVLPLNIIINI